MLCKLQIQLHIIEHKQQTINLQKIIETNVPLIHNVHTYIHIQCTAVVHKIRPMGQIWSMICHAGHFKTSIRYGTSPLP